VKRLCFVAGILRLSVVSTAEEAAKATVIDTMALSASAFMGVF
jgi:hypothetical protein